MACINVHIASMCKNVSIRFCYQSQNVHAIHDLIDDKLTLLPATLNI